STARAEGCSPTPVPVAMPGSIAHGLSPRSGRRSVSAAPGRGCRRSARWPRSQRWPGAGWSEASRRGGRRPGGLGTAGRGGRGGEGGGGGAVLAVSGKAYGWLGWRQRQVQTLLAVWLADAWTRHRAGAGPKGPFAPGYHGFLWIMAR